MNFESVARRVFDLYWEQRYDEALELVEEARSDHPHEDGQLTFFQACLLGISGRSPEALETLESGLERGLFWAPDFLADSDLDSVRRLSGWEGVERRCVEATQRFMASHHPQAQTRPGWVEEAAGTLITLHGAGADPLAHMERWAAAVPESWTVIAPEGTVPFSETQRAWPRDDPAGVVVAQLDGLAIPPPIVLAGYSQGAGVAAFLAWDGVLEPVGLILMAPPIFRSRVWDPQADQRVPTYMVVGQHDHSLSGCLELQRCMQEARASIHLDQRPDLGHQLPDDLATTIAAALDWITNHYS